MKFIFNVPTRLLKGQIWIAVCGIVAAFALSTCGVLRKLADTSSPGYDQIGGLVRDSGFEEESWGISAPPGYGEYAEINIDEKIKHKGRRSGHVYLQRHPRGNVRVLHAWTQTLQAVPPGARIRFGGWVRAERGTQVSLSLRCEFETPVNGKRYVSVETEQPTQFGEFQYVEKTVVMPASTATALSLHAGLSDLGEVWFDNLFVRILKD